MGKTVAAISGGAMALLERYDWPGNIRELENVIERAVALERTPTILFESLPEQIRVTMAGTPAATAAGDVPELPAGGFDLERHVQSVERRYLAQALERAGGVQVRAAELLGMSFRSFRYYAKKYNLK
jgi:two-component system, NtrC family, response regulator PilR